MLGRDQRPVAGTPTGRNVPVIRFSGLWTPAQPYGLPIDEMTRGVSQWIWPLEIPSPRYIPAW